MHCELQTTEFELKNGRGGGGGAPSFTWSLTLVDRSLLLNCTETLATQARIFVHASVIVDQDHLSGAL